MNVIDIEIRNKIAKTTSNVKYVCGNSDYLIRFSFDEEWDQYETKTARIVNGDGEYYDMVFTGCECNMPIISNAYAIKIGVFAGNLHTTTPAYVPAVKSILCNGGAPADPPEDVYNQIMELIKSGGVTPEAIEGAVKQYLEKHPIQSDESDPTVPQWAKEPEKPTYTAEDVGALPADAEIIDKDARETIGQLSEEKVDKNGTKQVTKENTTFWQNIATENLFDYQAAIVGSYINNNNGALVASAGCCYAYVPLIGIGTYQLRCIAATYGKPGAARIPLFDADKNYIKTIKGVETDPTATDRDRYPVSIEITNTEINDGCVYIGYTTYNHIKDTVMIVKGDRYPSKYIPYGKVWAIPEMEETIGKKAQQLLNPLYRMTAIFDGDSLCNGSSAEDGKSGWAGRIGEKNEMLWHNYAQGGGTIMQTDGKYWIGGNIDTILVNYPNLDYLILEGGVNDADVWGDDYLGVFDINDFDGTYDENTFSGALETLFFKAVTNFKCAKIGYIIPHKQGPSGYERTKYFDRAAEICEKWGVPYIDLWKCAHLDKRLSAHWDSTLDIAGNIAAGYLYTDGQHLTAQGYDVITPKIEAWMKTL